MTKLKQVLITKLCSLLGLYPVFAVNKEDQRSIIESADFQPNDVY